VPQVDEDGIDIAGIRLPEEAVPLSTDTGWAFRSEKIGAPDTLIAMIGSYIPLPVTRAERLRTRDPRMSVVERYGNRAEYQRRVREAANKLVADRYVLREDVEGIVEHAGRHWDFVMARPKVSGGIP
jgi:Alpha/beta hydrolase domain